MIIYMLLTIIIPCITTIIGMTYPLLLSYNQPPDVGFQKALPGADLDANELQAAILEVQ